MMRFCAPSYGAGLLLAAVLAASCTAAKPSLQTPEGQNFIGEARAIYRHLACGEHAVPGGAATASADAHCAALERKVADYRRLFIDRCAAFMSREITGPPPDAVVYPFGGSDLFAALATFPGARTITTISLETAGDPRPLLKDDPAARARARGDFLSLCGKFLDMQDNSYKNLRQTERAAFPGQVAMSIMAARIYGYEPVSLRFFRLDERGAIRYLSKDDISSLEGVRAPVLHPKQPRATCSAAFMNMEIAYRESGGSSRRMGFVHRHIAVNLHNAGFRGSPLHRHLQSLGSFAAMTRGASYLFWYDGFTAIRDCLLGCMTIMVSDATGILPGHAAAAGFQATAYGRFHGALLQELEGGAEDMRKLWREQPYRPIDFRYGYADIKGSPHLVIYRRRAPAR